MELIIRKHNSLFGHVARLGDDTPAHEAIWHQIDIFLGPLSGCILGNVLRVAQEASGWIRVILTTSYCPTADLWRCAVKVILG